MRQSPAIDTFVVLLWGVSTTASMPVPRRQVREFTKVCFVYTGPAWSTCHLGTSHSGGFLGQFILFFITLRGTHLQNDRLAFTAKQRKSRRVQAGIDPHSFLTPDKEAHEAAFN